MKTRVSAMLCIMLLLMLMGTGSYGQDAACTFSVSPDTIYFFDVFGGTAEVQVTASAPTCAFSAKTAYTWITVSVTQERGGGKILVTVGGNESLTHRVGSVSIDGGGVTVIQYGPRRVGD